LLQRYHAVYLSVTMVTSTAYLSVTMVTSTAYLSVMEVSTNVASGKRWW